MGIKMKVLKNKKNDQLSIYLPKAKLSFLKNKTPKFINVNINEEDFEY